jgi:hypothetical protein
MGTGNTERAITKTFRLSDQLSVDITVGPNNYLCEWTPAVPRKLTRQEMRAYERAREQMLDKLSEMVGGKVMMLTL